MNNQNQLEDMRSFPSASLSHYYCSSLARGGTSSSSLSDLQTLEASFRRFGLSDSNARQPTVVNNLRNHQYPLESQARGMNGRGYWFPLNSQVYEREQNNNQSQRLLSPMTNGINNSYANDFHGASTSSSSGILSGSTYPRLNRNFGDVPSSPRNSFLNQNPWNYSHDYFVPIRNGGGGSAYNHEPYTMNNGVPTILSRSKDRVESRQLQDEIEEGSRETFDQIFDSLVPHFFELMVDSFGHHVFLKLLEKSTDEQINQILYMFSQQLQQIVSVCCDSHGSRVIQDLMRSLSSEEQITSLMLTLSHVAVQLAKNNNAYSVIVFCFNRFSHVQIRYLLQVIVQNCYQIATDEHGCCMLQQCIGKSCGRVRNSLIMEIVTNALNLCVNCYGNYVVQYVLDLEDQRVADALSRYLDGRYTQLSYDKYGSHAVQKCLKSRVFDSRRIIIELLMDIETLVVNPYGNYVIQTAFSVSQKDVRDEMLYRIQQNSSYMKYNRYGRKVLEKLNLRT